MAFDTEPQCAPIVTRAEAIAIGAMFYFTGSPCKRGHITNKYVSTSECVTCVSLRSAVTRKENADSIRIKRQKKYRENADEICASRKQRYATDTEYVAARKVYLAAWRLANPRGRDAFEKKYRDKNKEKISIKHAARYAADPAANLAATKAWRALNPEKHKAVAQNTRAKRKLAEGTHTGQEIKNLLLIQDGKCAYFSVCGRQLADDWHPDHIIPLAKGGTNWISNIQLCCIPCNLSKSSKDPEVWAKRIGFVCDQMVSPWLSGSWSPPGGTLMRPPPVCEFGSPGHGSLPSCFQNTSFSGHISVVGPVGAPGISTSIFSAMGGSFRGRICQWLADPEARRGPDRPRFRCRSCKDQAWRATGLASTPVP